MIRTHEAGALRRHDAGAEVVLAGWVARRRDHGGVVFLDLREASGVVQVVVREDDLAHDLRSEYCIKVTGAVRVRPEGNENPEIPTGEIEVVASEIEVLSEAAPLPFQLEGAGDVAEETRLRYRYLDIRRQEMAENLRIRSKATYIAHEIMNENGFVYVETPYMTRSTPEGARDFLVPVRLQPGNWYALPQSPQLFKQLLMVGGMERYYQLTRCFRDEDLRADRQPEFTQIDLEMSFVDEEDIFAIGEQLFSRLLREIRDVELPRPFRRMRFAEAMDRFGSDKPDLRFGQELVELTDFFSETPFRVFQAPYVGAVVMPGGATQTRRELDAWQEWAKSRGAKGLAYVLVQEDGTLGGPVAKNLSEQERSGLAERVGARPGDAVFFAAGQRAASQELLGAARLEIGRRCGLIDESRWEILWITDMPLFEEGEEPGTWTSVHHPFTAPAVEVEDTFQDDPGAANSRAFDLVLNGYELVSGSIRIHRAEMQQRVFDVIGLSKAEAETKFGFLLEAFKYGPPPHGGLAVGWDRLVMLLAGQNTIREVIAFPKTASGGDPLTGAPTQITPEQREEAGIDFVPEDEA
ncbi:aspartate--tRNA ligase [Marinactinospora thermotolerans]|uniref:Aspartate--tRNA(Asp/Asn) ligase n=1 Tax=Marinactinospora thermotolerans DSM 45154 TaxID=1122192 RepID=A0A1T4SLA3_9ACTN|nr:aspartate--tRNA ligase [Marinactinospora thermotolerans]SKA28688.1 aspartyl-tRNA synthetase [Marinactinospora thermotolerans DSM 45154]